MKAVKILGGQMFDSPLHRRCAYALVPVLLLAGTSCTTEDAGEQAHAVDHVVANEPRQNPEGVPDSISGIGWDWEAPEGVEITAVDSIPAGVVVSLSDGAIALHGDSGEELWRYRRTGERMSGHGVTPDSSLVALSYSTSSEPASDTAEHEIVLLDSATGEIENAHSTMFTLTDSISDGVLLLDPMPERLGLITNSSRLVFNPLEDDGWELRSINLASGEEDWSKSDFRPESEVGSYFQPGQIDVFGETIVYTGVFMLPVNGDLDYDQVQEHTWVVAGLDSETGDEIWRTEQVMNEPVTPRGISLSSSSEDEIVGAVLRGRQLRQWFLDTRSGRPVTSEEVFDDAGDVGVFSVRPDGYSVVRSDFESEVETISRISFSGDVLDSLTFEESDVVGPENFIFELSDEFVRVQAGRDGPGWQPASLEITSWDESSPTRTIDIGVDIHRDPWEVDSLESPYQVSLPDYATLAPGAVVISEVTTDNTLDESGTESRRIVGLQ